MYIYIYIHIRTHSAQELLQYDGAILTEALVKRVFEECQTYEGEMDFKSFLDFVLAIQNRSSRPAQVYMCVHVDVCMWRIWM